MGLRDAAPFSFHVCRRYPIGQRPEPALPMEEPQA
jgi:hypothetical protein